MADDPDELVKKYEPLPTYFSESKPAYIGYDEIADFKNNAKKINTKSIDISANLAAKAPKPEGVPGRLKKNDPKVEAKKKRWEAETIAEQQALLEESSKLMDSYLFRIQVLELQVDELRALVAALAAKTEELDDRVNWLET